MKMDFQNFKSAAQFPFPQSQITFIVSNAAPLIDFSLKMLATGRVEPTIRISVVTQPLNFPVFNRVHSTVEARFSGHRFSGKPRFKGHSSKNLGNHFYSAPPLLTTEHCSSSLVVMSLLC